MNKAIISKKNNSNLEIVPKCEKCKLYATCLTPKIQVQGNGKKGILLVRESPGKTDDETGVLFSGESGKILEDCLKEADILMDRDCWKITAVACRPPKGKKPTDGKITYCRPLIRKAITDIKPKLVITLGEVASKSVIMMDWAKDFGGISRWRGIQIPDVPKNIWICPVFDPSYVRDNERSTIHRDIFINDLKNAVKCLKNQCPASFNQSLDELKSKVKIISEEKAVKIIRRWNKSLNVPIAFDYETTGLKPYNKKHEIVTASICAGRNTTYAFTMKSVEIRRAFKLLLENQNIPKIAHNIKFENTWSTVKLNAQIRQWFWDSMLAAHYLDNRRKYCSLKFQTYINFGIPDYDSTVSKYLEGDDKRGISFNKIYDAPINDVLLYNGLDSLFNYMLAEVQINQIGTKFGDKSMPFFPF